MAENLKKLRIGKKKIPQQVHDRSLSWFGPGTSLKSGGVKLVL
jgi:hypothetical protein